MDSLGAIAGQADFSLRLAGHVAPKHAARSNLVFAPLSLYLALGLVAAGSAGDTLQQLVSFLRPSAAAGSAGGILQQLVSFLRPSAAAGSAGGTLQQLVSFLRPSAAAGSSKGSLNSLASQVVNLVLADGSPVGGPRVSFASGAWGGQSLRPKPPFKQVAASAFKAEATAANFPAKASEVTVDVDSWAENATGGLIRNLPPAGSVDHGTRLFLDNKLYFKGAWTEKFDASQTTESAFHLLDGSSVSAPFMTSKKKQFIRANDGFKSLKLPYCKGDDRRQFSMYLFLPDAKDGIWDLAEKLASDGGNLDRYLPERKVEVGGLRIPKFKLSFGFEASGVMKEMGLVLPFSGGELTEMVDSALGKQLFVSGIFHRSAVEVNEEGTEAAAASAAVVGLRSLPPPSPTDFVVDHPFIFLIREDLTGVILFIGHVINPLLSR